MAKSIQQIKKDNSFYQSKIDQLTESFNKLKSKFQDVGADKQNLYNIDNQLYRKIILMQKDLQILKQKVQYLKDSTIQILTASGTKYQQLNTQFQEVSGSVNQLKMAVQQIQKKHESQKQLTYNWFWQFIIPILLALVFFVFGLFTKSCSAVLPEIQRQTQKSEQDQYIYFDSVNNK